MGACKEFRFINLLISVIDLFTIGRQKFSRQLGVLAVARSSPGDFTDDVDLGEGQVADHVENLVPSAFR